MTTIMKGSNRIPGSYKDPSGFVFYKDGEIFRQVNNSYKENFDLLINSGLYENLAGSRMLVSHKEADPIPFNGGEAYKVIKPEKIDFISYPYEWSFSQLKDAALLTLEIQKKSLDFGMSLKDCSSYNVQFKDGSPIFIDTLSFEKYVEGRPWVAYRQFCQHFLAPLALMSRKSVDLAQLLKIYVDGIPLELTDRLLPLGSKLDFSLLIHVHLHAGAKKYFSSNEGVKAEDEGKVSKNAMMGLIDSLQGAAKKLEWKPKGTEWSDYYNDTNYSSVGLEHKKEIVSRFLDETKADSLWDLGANNGFFTRIASEKGVKTIAFDVDPAAVEQNYLEMRRRKEKNILPLLGDLCNPSPGIGWGNTERYSLIERGPADAALVLALIHHLAISNNVPFGKIAELLSRLCTWLIIEFIPREDSQVKRLFVVRQDIFSEYNIGAFETEFAGHFEIIKSEKIKDSSRTIYLMRKKAVMKP